MNELVTNSLEHGLSGKDSGTISVEFDIDEQMNHHLIVSDNGTGAEIDELESSDSLGLRLVRNLTNDQLHGTIEFTQDEGLTVKVTFPPTEIRYQ